MMRRLFVALACCVVLQAILPAPVYGWWEKIEEWSGPGPFYGWTIDARLVCFLSDEKDDSLKVKKRWDHLLRVSKPRRSQTSRFNRSWHGFPVGDGRDG